MLFPNFQRYGKLPGKSLNLDLVFYPGLLMTQFYSLQVNFAQDELLLFQPILCCFPTFPSIGENDANFSRAIALFKQLVPLPAVCCHSVFRQKG